MKWYSQHKYKADESYHWGDEPLKPYLGIDGLNIAIQKKVDAIHLDIGSYENAEFAKNVKKMGLYL